MGVHHRRDVEQEDLPVRAPAVQEQDGRTPGARGRGGPAGRPRVEHVHAPSEQLEWPLHRGPVDAQPGSVVAVGIGRIRARAQDPVAHHSGHPCGCRSHVGATVSTACREYRDRHRLHPAPLLGPALRCGPAPLRDRAALRGPGHVGHHPAAPRAGARLRRGDPLRGARAGGRALSGRGGGGQRMARGRSFHPRHLAPHDRVPGGHRALAEADRPALRRAVLLVRQDRPLQGDRDRRLDRRLAGHLGESAGGRHHRGDPAAPVEPRAVRDGGRHLRARLARACAEARTGARMTTRPTSPAVTGARRALPPATGSDDLRDHLPAIEPERTVSDWGRSERLEGLLDQTLVSFLYHYWFRCEVEGIENVPATGGALLVSNHAGALPPDASMIAKAIQEEHPRPRKLHLTVEHFFKGYPFFSMFVAKIGGVPAHPANVHRLLHDEQQLVLVFPEGAKATEKLYKDRYKLRRFGRGGFVEAAMRAGVPIVPVAVVGAEEAMPTFAQIGLLKRVTALIYFPITPLFPHLGLLGFVGYLPAKFKIRFLEPVATDQWGEEPWNDRGLIQTVADEIRGRIQEELIDMLANRRSVWF